jgi:hypothetical protein
MAVVLAFLPGSSQAAVAHHPQPSQERVIDYPNGTVIHLFAHPVGPVPPPTGPSAQTAATSHNLYLICETSLNPTHCLALDSASTTILVTALITTICQFVDCPELLRAITSRGSNNDKGDVTFQAEGSYTGHDGDFFHDCVAQPPTRRTSTTTSTGPSRRGASVRCISRGSTRSSRGRGTATT